MIRIFLDTEFTTLTAIDDPALISIGLVSECGTKHFYAELTDTWNVGMCSAFVLEAVLPLLGGGDARMALKEAGHRLHDWITAFGDTVEVYSDAPGYDWPWVYDLMQAYGKWPDNFVTKCLPLIFDGERGQKYAQTVEQAYANGLRRHHALDDAETMRLGWLAISTMQ